MSSAKSGAVRHILHPSDFSPASNAAFTKALALARDAGAQMTIVHVLSSMVTLPVDGYMSPTVYEEFRRSAETYAGKKLAALVSRHGRPACERRACSSRASPPTGSWPRLGGPAPISS
jgi:nucleotide-binding universal stress UspA family protein